MTITDIEPTLDDLLRVAFDAFFAQVNGPLPGEVQSYNQGNQTVDVLPLIQIWKDGAFVVPKVITGITVAFPQGNGGASSITWPLVKGDVVDLIPQGADISAWKISNVQPNQPPASRRRFSMSDLIAIPGIRSQASTLPGTAIAADGLVIASRPFVYMGSSAATDFAALASLIDGHFLADKVWKDTHSHAALGAPPSTASPVPPATVGSSVVKVDP